MTCRLWSRAEEVASSNYDIYKKMKKNFKIRHNIIKGQYNIFINELECKMEKNQN